MIVTVNPEALANENISIDLDPSDGDFTKIILTALAVKKCLTSTSLKHLVDSENFEVATFG